MRSFALTSRCLCERSTLPAFDSLYRPMGMPTFFTMWGKTDGNGYELFVVELRGAADDNRRRRRLASALGLLRQAGRQLTWKTTIICWRSPSSSSASPGSLCIFLSAESPAARLTLRYSFRWVLAVIGARWRQLQWRDRSQRNRPRSASRRQGIAVQDVVEPGAL